MKRWALFTTEHSEFLERNEVNPDSSEPCFVKGDPDGDNRIGIRPRQAFLIDHYESIGAGDDPAYDASGNLESFREYDIAAMTRDVEDDE